LHAFLFPNMWQIMGYGVSIDTDYLLRRASWSSMCKLPSQLCYCSSPCITSIHWSVIIPLCFM